MSKAKRKEEAIAHQRELARIGHIQNPSQRAYEYLRFITMKMAIRETMKGFAKIA